MNVRIRKDMKKDPEKIPIKKGQPVKSVLTGYEILGHEVNFRVYPFGTNNGVVFSVMCLN